MLPQLEWAKSKGYPVLVMNSTFAEEEPSQVAEARKGLHGAYVWRTFIKDSGFKKIHIVANSAGERCLREMQEAYSDSFYKIVG